MNILFTTSAAPQKTPFSVKEKRPPLGLGYLISLVRNAGHQVFFIDNYLKPENFWESDYLIANNIDIVGVYANTICYTETLNMLQGMQTLREEKKWTGRIIVGGPHTTVALATIPEFADHIVLGEGEKAILDIIEGRETERVVRRERLKDLDKLPYPAWEIFSKLPYDYTCRWIDIEPIFTMNTSRGCPFNCHFCSVGSIWGRGYTFYSAQRIVDEVKYLMANYGAKGIYFREDNFTLRKDRVEEFCKLIIKDKIDIKWACETRVDTLDRDFIQLMYQAGCRAFYIGVESASQRLLNFMNKNINLEQIKLVFKLCREIGINTYASFVTGIPTETMAETRKTMAFINTELKPYDYYISVFVGIPDSPLYKYTLEHNLYEHIDQRGLVYLYGHNERMKIFNGDNPDMLIDYDESNTEFVKEVSEMRETILNRIKKLIERCKSEGKKMAIYGAGLQTERLFKQIDFSGVTLTGFYDISPDKQKQGFMGYQVFPPEYITERDQDIILISLTKPLFKVYEQLMKLGEKKFEIISLYQPDELYVL